jgi:hypothetical protein
MEPQTYNNQAFPTGAYGNITNNFTLYIRMHETTLIWCWVMQQVTVSSQYSVSKDKELKFINK